jgi:hypothetical protein
MLPPKKVPPTPARGFLFVWVVQRALHSATKPFSSAMKPNCRADEAVLK